MESSLGSVPGSASERAKAFSTNRSPKNFPEIFPISCRPVFPGAARTRSGAARGGKLCVMALRVLPGA